MRKPGLKWTEDQEGVTCFCKMQELGVHFYHGEKTACKRMILMM